MTLNAEIDELCIRMSLNLIYTLSRTLTVALTMEGDVASDVLRSSSELILREAVTLSDRIKNVLEDRHETH